MNEELKGQNLRAHVIHYLEDFLLVLPPSATIIKCGEIFANLCLQVGLSIKASKNKQGKGVSFAGIEFNTKCMAIRLPKKKLLKARTIVHNATQKKSLSLLEIQKITGYLNFASTVIPLGRTFLRLLYNMELYFAPGSRHLQRRIS